VPGRLVVISTFQSPCMRGPSRVKAPSIWLVCSVFTWAAATGPGTADMGISPLACASSRPWSSTAISRRATRSPSRR